MRRNAARARSVRAASILLALFTLACGSVPWGTAPVSEEQQRAYEAARAQREADPEGARAALLEFVARWPDSALTDDAEVDLAELALAEGDTVAARRHYQRVVRDHPRGDRVDQARVRLAVLEQQAGNVEAARATVGRARLARLEGDDLRNAYRVLADVAPEPVARLRWLSLLRSEVPSEQVPAIDEEIDSAIVALDSEGLARAARQLGERIPAARLHVARAERALDAGDLVEARDALEQASRLPLEPRYGARLAAASARLRMREQGPSDVSDLPTFADVMDRERPDTSAARGALGVVLPLTGPFAQFGERTLHGVLLATAVFEESGPDIRVVVRDSGGNPARAAAAVRELAADDEIAAIVGPLLSAESEAAAAAAQDEGIPLLALTSRPEIASTRDLVFRLRTRPQEEVQLLVERARAMGAERFAILYRDDPYGRGLRSLFWEAVEAHGGSIVGVASYDPTATDFAGPIRRLVGYVLLNDDEKQRIARREGMLRKARRLPAEQALELRQRARRLTASNGSPLPPIVDFDALFIPESHENVVLIAPQLAFHEVTDTRLLGPDGWYHPDLVRLGREHVEGALFASHFYPESEVPYVKAFAAQFQASFERRPDVFAAQAYDAANLVLTQLARGLTSREAVRDGVLAAEAYPGVSGVITMRADGNAQKRPYLLGVEKGHVVEYVD